MKKKFKKIRKELKTNKTNIEDNENKMDRHQAQLRIQELDISRLNELKLMWKSRAKERALKSKVNHYTFLASTIHSHFLHAEVQKIIKIKKSTKI